MPFRAKFRKALGVKPRQDSKASKKEVEDGDNTPDLTIIHPTTHEWYKPGKAPPSKYQGRWDPKHQNSLKSFNFSGLSLIPVSRRSSMSAQSPGGGNLKSAASSRRSSLLGSNLGQRSQRASLSAPATSEPQAARSKSIVGNAVPEADDDDADVTNVGLSRPTTRGGLRRGADRPDTDTIVDREDSDDTLRNSQDNLTQQTTPKSVPFSVHELSRALTATTVTVGS